MSLECKVNSESFEAGETIELIVKVSVKDQNEAESLKGGFLRVDIKGEEYACVHWTDKSGEDHFERQSSTICSQARILKEYKDAASLGVFEYTYQYHLHEKLPSSYSLEGGHNNCDIRYGMQVTLKKSKGNDEMWKYLIPVHARPAVSPTSETGRFLLPEQQHINFCNLCGRGTMTVGACLSKTVIKQHDSFTVSFTVLNQSLVKISKIEVGLFQTIHLEAKKKRAYKKIPLVMENFDPKDLKGSDKVKKVDKTLSPDEQAAKVLKILNSDNSSEKMTFKFNLRPDAFESFKGKKIRVRHSILIRLKTAGGFSNVELKSVVKVLPCGKNLKEYYIEKAGVEHHGEHKKTTCRLVTSDDIEEDEDENVPEFDNGNNQLRTFLVPRNSKLVLGQSTRPLYVEPDQTVGFAKKYPATYEGLVQAMDETLEDYTLIERYISDASLGFKDILANLTPEQFGSVVSSVDHTYDQSAVATVLQKLMGPKYTCMHVATAVRMCPEQTRSEIVRATARKAADFNENRPQIEKCLSKMDTILLDTI